jgi:hypothetical protein
MDQSPIVLTRYVLRFTRYVLICDVRAHSAYGVGRLPYTASSLRVVLNGTGGYQLAFAVDLPLSG